MIRYTPVDRGGIMKKTVIKPGQILVKRDGVIYELDHATFNTIRTIIFDTDSDLCRYCKRPFCKDRKQIENSFITDAVTLKDKPICDHVLGCTNSTLEEECGIRRLAWFSSDWQEPEIEEEQSMAERELTHYLDGSCLSAHLPNPTLRKFIARVK